MAKTSYSSIVIIGALGYVGLSCLDKLSGTLSQSIRVVGVDLPLMERHPNHLKYIDKVEFIFTDDLSTIPWSKYPSPIHIVYSAVASSHLLEKIDIKNGYLDDLQNLTRLYSGTVDFSNSITLSYLSSGAVYGNRNGFLSEEEKLEANNPYSLMKISSEMLIKYMAKTLDQPTYIFRLFNPYSHFQNTNTLIGKILNSINDPSSSLKLFKKGSQLRTFLFINDLVDVLFLQPSLPGATVYNLGSDQVSTIKDFADSLDAIYELVGQTDLNDIVIPVITKIKQQLSWHPKYSIDKGTAIVKNRLQHIIS